MNKTTQATRNKRYRNLLSAATVIEPLTLPLASNNLTFRSSSKTESVVSHRHREALPDQDTAYRCRTSRQPVAQTSHLTSRLRPALAIPAEGSSHSGARPSAWPKATHSPASNPHSSSCQPSPPTPIQGVLESQETILYSHPSLTPSIARESPARLSGQGRMPMINDIEALLDKFRQDDKTGPVAKQPSSVGSPGGGHDGPSSGAAPKERQSGKDSHLEHLVSQQQATINILEKDLTDRINQLHQAQQALNSKDQEARQLKASTTAREELISEAQAALVNAVSQSTSDKEEIDRLTAQLKAQTQELDAERELKEQAVAKQIEAEVKENSACKHQSSLAKRLEAANSQLEDTEKRRVEAEQAKLKAEQRATDAENTARRSGPRFLPPHPRVADLEREIHNRDLAVQRCNAQLADAKHKIVTQLDKIVQIRADNTGLRERNKELLDNEQMAKKAIYDRKQLKLHVEDIEQLLEEERKLSRALQKRLDTLEREQSRLRGRLDKARSPSVMGETVRTYEAGPAVSEVMSVSDAMVPSFSPTPNPKPARTHTSPPTTPTPRQLSDIPALTAQAKPDPRFEESVKTPEKLLPSTATTPRKLVNAGLDHEAAQPQALQDLASINPSMAELAGVNLSSRPILNQGHKTFQAVRQQLISDPYAGLGGLFVHDATTAVPVQPSSTPVSANGRDLTHFDHLLGHLEGARKSATSEVVRAVAGSSKHTHGLLL